MRFLVYTKNSIFVMRITVVYFVNVTCTYSSILVKWVSFISGYTNISILVFLFCTLQKYPYLCIQIEKQKAYDNYDPV